MSSLALPKCFVLLLAIGIVAGCTSTRVSVREIEPEKMAAVAGLLEQQGRNDDAERIYQRMLEADPRSTVARKGLARVGVPSDRTGQSRSEMLASIGVARIVVEDEDIQSTADWNAAPSSVIKQTSAVQSVSGAQAQLADAAPNSGFKRVRRSPNEAGQLHLPGAVVDSGQNAEPETEVVPGVASAAPTVPSARAQNGGRNTESAVVFANDSRPSLPAGGRVTDSIISSPISVKRPDALSEVLRECAQRLLIEAVQREVGLPTAPSDASENESSRRSNVQNGQPARTIIEAQPKSPDETNENEVGEWYRPLQEPKSIR